MAKMFYTIDEAAQKLGLDEDAVKKMATDGKLQQFRDRDKLMFKRDQVDALSASGASASGISLADSGDSDAIDLRADSSAGTSMGLPTGVAPPSAPPAPPTAADPRDATGISVFDAGEVDHADPMAQTQVTEPAFADEDLALESVGSGSGLLDLTRESDDTSLGAELLDEIYPGSGDASGTNLGSAAGSSGVFEGTLSMETGASGPSGLENLGEPSPVEPTAASPTAPITQAPYAVEEDDPAGSGLTAGLFIGAAITLVLGLIILAGAVTDAPSAITTTMHNSLMLWTIGLVVASAVFGGVGLFVGKSMGGSR